MAHASRCTASAAAVCSPAQAEVWPLMIDWLRAATATAADG
jgi:hypothetical protein